MKAAAIAVSLVLAGCSSMAIENEYQSAERISIPLEMSRTYIKSIVVRFHPKDEHRASVTSGKGALTEAFAEGGARWMARIEEFRTAYEAALLDQLAQHGRQCAITETYPYPDTFTFDFRYSCD